MTSREKAAAGELALMRQMTLAAVGFEKYGKLTWRAAFLAEMDAVVPWQELSVLIAPFYPKVGRAALAG